MTTTYLPRRPKTKSNRKLTPTNGRGTAELREDSVACLRLAYRQPTGETRVLRSGTPVSVQMHHFSRGFSLKELQNFTRKNCFRVNCKGNPMNNQPHGLGIRNNILQTKNDIPTVWIKMGQGAPPFRLMLFFFPDVFGSRSPVMQKQISPKNGIPVS